MPYRRTEEQYEAIRTIRDRLEAIADAAADALKALQRDVLAEGTFRDAEPDEFGSPADRIAEALEGRGITRAFEEVRMAVLDWAPDHGTYLTPCPPGEYGA